MLATQTLQQMLSARWITASMVRNHPQISAIAGNVGGLPNYATTLIARYAQITTRIEWFLQPAPHISPSAISFTATVFDIFRFWKGFQCLRVCRNLSIGLKHFFIFWI